MDLRPRTHRHLEMEDQILGMRHTVERVTKRDLDYFKECWADLCALDFGWTAEEVDEWLEPGYYFVDLQGFTAPEYLAKRAADAWQELDYTYGEMLAV